MLAKETVQSSFGLDTVTIDRSKKKVPVISYIGGSNIKLDEAQSFDTDLTITNMKEDH